jgi:hypothetical protein
MEGRVQNRVVDEFAMAIVSFDTLTYAKKLKSAGFTEQQAEVQAEAQGELLRRPAESQAEYLATKMDLHELRSEMERQLNELRSEMERQNNELRTDVERQIGDLRTEIAELRADFESRFARIQMRFNLIQRLIYIVLGGIALLFIRSFL